MPNSAGFTTSQLDRLSMKEILLQLDIPSLTRFRSLSHRAMQFVNSVCQWYTAIIEHCPDIIRTIVSIQVDASGCAKLYRTLFTTQCSTYNRFGDYLYLHREARALPHYQPRSMQVLHLQRRVTEQS